MLSNDRLFGHSQWSCSLYRDQRDWRSGRVGVSSGLIYLCLVFEMVARIPIEILGGISTTCGLCGSVCSTPWPRGSVQNYGWGGRPGTVVDPLPALWHHWPTHTSTSSGFGDHYRGCNTDSEPRTTPPYGPWPVHRKKLMPLGVVEHNTSVIQSMTRTGQNIFLYMHPEFSNNIHCCIFFFYI